MKWIELVLGFRCNCRCRVCPGIGAGGSDLAAAEIEAALESSRRQGASCLWLGGGEPTLYPELFPIIRRARKMGYSEVRLETNGMRLAYPRYAEGLLEAGVTEVALSLKGADAESHDRLTQVEGSYDLLVAAAKNLAGKSVRLSVEYLLTTGSLDGASDCLRRFSDLGASGFLFWVVSLHGLGASAAAHLPSLAQAGRAVSRAATTAKKLGLAVESLHTPPCVLSPGARGAYRHAGKWDLVVFVPGGEPFRAEESPMEGGEYLPGCSRCRFRPDCLGLRRDYLSARGPGGIRPVTPGRR